jgi:Flp pilus assembly pilin Flp
MKELLNKLAADKSGASAAEYALILALVAIALVGLIGTFTGDLGTAFGQFTTAVAGEGGE